MEFKIIHKIDELDIIRDNWNDLLTHMDNREVFYSWNWTYEYLRCIDNNLTDCLSIILVFEKKELIAILPFLNENGTIRFITNKTVDYNNIYINKEFNKYTIIEKAISYIFENITFSKIQLDNIQGNSELFIINDVLKNTFNCITLIEDSVIVPKFIYCENSKLKYRTKQLKDIDRRKRKLEKENDLKITIGCNYDDEIWSFLCQHHKKRWKDSVLNNENYLQFYITIIKKMKENIEFSKLEINNKIVAVHFGFKTEEKVYYYIPIYDEEYSSSGVGYILLKEIIDKYSDKKEFDFLRGNESYKFNWSDNISMNFNLYAFKPSYKNYINYFLVYIKVFLKKSKTLRKLLNK